MGDCHQKDKPPGQAKPLATLVETILGLVSAVDKFLQTVGHEVPENFCLSL